MNEFQIRDAMLRGAERALRLTREELFGDRDDLDRDDGDDVYAVLELGNRFHVRLAQRLDAVERNIRDFAMAAAGNTPKLAGTPFTF